MQTNTNPRQCNKVVRKSTYKKKTDRVYISEITYEQAAEGKEFFDDQLHKLIYPFPVSGGFTQSGGVDNARIGKTSKPGQRR